MPEPRQNEAEIALWILRKLGAPQVEVELVQEDLDDAIADSKLWFKAKRGVIRSKDLYVQAGTSSRPLDDDMDTVTNVIYSETARDATFIPPTGWLMPDQGVPASIFYAPNDGGRFSNVVQTMQYLDSARRVMSAEPDWQQIGRTLHFHAVASTSRARVEYKSRSVVLQELDDRAFDLVRRMALAKSKEKLGELRTKYDSVATSAGSTTLNGSQLLEQAATAIEGLNEEIMQSGMPLGILIG